MYFMIVHLIFRKLRSQLFRRAPLVLDLLLCLGLLCFLALKLPNAPLFFWEVLLGIAFFF